MLAAGHRRIGKTEQGHRIAFAQGNAEALPFPNAHFDAYTIAFGIRNVTHIDRALAEAFRVLKIGGRFLCLEFSEVQVPMLDKLYDAWSFHAIPRLGRATAGDAQPYEYLVESIRKFPKQEAVRGHDPRGRFRAGEFPEPDGRRRRHAFGVEDLKGFWTRYWADDPCRDGLPLAPVILDPASRRRVPRRGSSVRLRAEGTTKSRRATRGVLCWIPETAASPAGSRRSRMTETTFGIEFRDDTDDHR